MKKSIIAVILAIATLATFMVPASASAVTWNEVENCEVPTYEVKIAEAGSIKVDANMENEYLGGDLIESFEEDEKWIRNAWKGYQNIIDVTRGDFWARIAVTTEGMFIYAEIEDITMFPTNRDNDPNEGDMIQIYMDWCEPAYGDQVFGGIDMMHPSPEAMYNFYTLNGQDWETANSYRTLWGYNGMMYLGWIAADYHNVIKGSWGFSGVKNLGMTGDKAVEYTSAKMGNEGWKCEFFIPWRDEFQAERIARGEQFHCSIGFQIGDDSDLRDEVDFWEDRDGDGEKETEVLEKSVGVTFDQRKSVGLEYYIGYTSLADLKWGEYPEGYFGEEVNTGVPVETSDSIIAIVAALCVAGAGVVLFSRKKED